MMLRQVFVILLLSAAICAQSVALSFDDGLNPETTPQADEWNSAILEALESAGVHSILFAAGRNVDSPGGLELVGDWGKRGHWIANHTYSHRNFASDKVTLEAFIADIKKNEGLLAEMPNWQRLFRYPYLKEGKTAEKRDALREWLRKNGYSAGPVSIDASDWYYSKRLLDWRKENAEADDALFRKAYLNHLWQRSVYYDSLSQQMLGRSAIHILLLHVNAVNARFLADVIEMYQSKGWKVVDFKEAISDPLYQMLPNTLPAGESILWSLAKEKGIADLRYPAEDSRYEKPMLDKLGL